MNFHIRNIVNRMFSYGKLFKLYNIAKGLVSSSSVYEAGEVDEFHKKNALQLDAKSGIEFGAERSLGQNLFLSDVLERQYLYDIDNLLIMKMVNSYACQLTEVFERGKEEVTKVEDLLKVGIHYYAPFDVRNDNTTKDIDIFLSTSTLEHIPEKDIKPLMLHIKGMLREGGRLSLHIDYSDHFSHTDSTIGRCNFLQFSDQEWSYYNTTVCYQNRLRHMHYKRIFIDCGLKIIYEEAKCYEVAPVTINRSLMTGHETDLATTGRWLLEK